MKLMKKKKGFTLIELMAVIAIIAVLAAVLVPTVSGYIDRANKMAVITQVRTVVNAVESYDATAPVGSRISDKADIKLSDIVDYSATRNTVPDTTTPIVSAFKKQELITEDDVTKLYKDVLVKDLKAINQDSNAVNNIYKNENKKFAYSKDSLTVTQLGN